MVDLTRVTGSLDELGNRLQNHLNSEYYQAKFKEAYYYNRWFTPKNVENAVKTIAEDFLNDQNLQQWVTNYRLPVDRSYKVGLIMAGNIPLVGFHDLLAVLVSGHEALVKLSSKDEILLPFIVKELAAIDPEVAEKIAFIDKMEGQDAIIATGSNNTARYFSYYFGQYPHIIRKNRNGVAILTGNESEEELRNLGHDIFTYFGLGCRNVSKLYVPESYDFQPLLSVLEEFREVINHQKYENNYLYNKGMLVMDSDAFMDTGFLMLRERDEIPSPMAMVHYSYYSKEASLSQEVEAHQSAIQCVIGQPQRVEIAEIAPGEAQRPQLWDYADKIDTLEFLASLEKATAKI